ncbi:MAG TPA: protein kinase, partial [Kofleriaceae bacterium]|nr:protein kinase [Kofleriaceae bacterium]
RQSRGEMVKLLDFGISRMVDRDATFRLTTTGLVLGTPYYMSPEQARGDGEVTIAADLYAFGVMLYEMLIGEVPIRAENYNQLMYRVMIGDFVRPGQRRHDLPAVLDQIIVRAMAQDPAARPSSANEIEHALLPLCRSGFRDAASGRLSAPGLPFRSSGAGGGPGGSGTGSGHGLPVAATLPDRNAAGHSGIGSGIGEVGTRPDRPPAAYGTSPGGATATVPNAPPRRARGGIIAVAAIAVVGAVIVAIALGGSGAAPGAATSSAPAVAPLAPPAPPPAAPPPAAPSPPAGAAAQVPDAGSNQAPGSAPAADPAAAPAAPPARAATITLRLAIEPEAAKVTIDGKPVSGPEIAVPRDDRLHRLKIIAPGYLAHEEPVAFDENQRVVVHLKRAAAGRGRNPRKDPDGITSRSPYD